MKILSSQTGLWLVVTAFILSRIIYYVCFDVRFDASPLIWFWQYIDPQLLQNNLLQSLWYMHSQPPLFNLFLGLVLKIFPVHFVAAFHWIYLMMGLVFSVMLYVIMVQMRVVPWISVLLTSLFIVSPIVISYEHWLFYEYPTTLILLFGVYFLNRFLLFGRQKDCFSFFISLAIIIYLRGLFSIYWFLLIGGILIVCNPPHRLKIFKAFLIPFLLVLCLYGKNLIIFKSFSINEAGIGQSLLLSITKVMPESMLEPLVKEHKLSSLYREKIFSSDWQYGLDIKTGVLLLDQKQKSTGYVNMHHMMFLRIGKQGIKDSSYIFQQYPLIIFHQRLSEFSRRYFLSTDNVFPFYLKNEEKKSQWIEWNYFWRTFFLGESSNGQCLYLVVGLPIIFVYGLILSFRLLCNKQINPLISQSALFMIVTISFLLVSTLFINREQNRYRFLVDPLYLILFGLMINELKEAFVSKKGKYGAKFS